LFGRERFDFPLYSRAPSGDSQLQPVLPSSSAQWQARGGEHAVPHVPQSWFELVGVSHPSAKTPLQSPQPGLQDPTLHSPARHPGVPFTIGSTC
jgi:hypothetical protein